MFGGEHRDRKQSQTGRRLTRRSLIARLDPKTDRPELRQFDYDPLMDARDHRAELVAAALTILKAYCVAGMPGRPPQLQSFEDWSDTVRGALLWIGLEDPAATQDRLRENDPKLTTLIRVTTVWRKAFGAAATTVAEAVEKAEAKRRVGTWEDSKFEPIDPDLLDAFMAVARRGAALNPETLGKYLRSEAERVVAGETAPESGLKGRERSTARSFGPWPRSPPARRKPARMRFPTDCATLSWVGGEDRGGGSIHAREIGKTVSYIHLKLPPLSSPLPLLRYILRNTPSLLGGQAHPRRKQYVEL